MKMLQSVIIFTVIFFFFVSLSLRLELLYERTRELLFWTYQGLRFLTIFMFSVFICTLEKNLKDRLDLTFDWTIITFYDLFLSFTRPHIHAFDWIYLSLSQDDTLHFAVQVAEESPSASDHTGEEERCTLPQVLVTPQTKLLTSQESRILANPDCLCCDQKKLQLHCKFFCNCKTVNSNMWKPWMFSMVWQILFFFICVGLMIIIIYATRVYLFHVWRGKALL